MDLPILTGLRGFHQQPGEYGFTESGSYGTFVYEGTVEEIQQLAATFYARGVLHRVSARFGGRARLEARFDHNPQGNQQERVDLWELFSQPVEKDLMEADFPHGTLGNISDDNKAILLDALNNPGDFTASSPPFTGGTAAAANSYFLLMQAGVRSFPEEAPVVRYTYFVSSLFAVQASFTNVRRILSDATFIALEGVPSTLLFTTPTTPAVTQFIETAGDLQYGWRKAFPTVQQIAFKKWQIVQEWQFGLWAVKIHGNVL